MGAEAPTARPAPAARGLRGTRAAVAVSAAFGVTMIGVSLPTPLYALYSRELGFDGVVVTLVFSTYAVGVAAALVLFGPLSDQLGRRAILLPGLALAAASSAVFLIPHSLPALFAGRLLSGLSAGVFTGTATAMLVDLAPPGRKRHYSLAAASVNMLGVGLGPVVAGVLAEFAPAPLVVPYLVHLLLVLCAAVALRAVAEPRPRAAGPVRWRPQRMGVPPAARPAFVRAATGGVAGFAVLGLFTSVSPAFLSQVLGITDHVSGGLVVLALLGTSAAGQVASARLAERSAALVGTSALLVGVVLIGLSIAAVSLFLLLAGAVVAGVGQGMSFRAGLDAVSTAAPEERRGEVTSSFFLVLYGAISLPVIGVGVAAQARGLVWAGVLFTGAVALVAAVALVMLLRRGDETAS
ncbi:MFS family permease [Saccharothrix coeruleofusca]|uniref:MFS transporter n=1 Tax=Saccharothrix coeruleofusca TaxID=33919 RepID=UPI001AE7FDC4|nr:MFS transporter [Saccharothrix coeruleofusca]MBP2336151.1 MFS family permease [Saccharothrix coeruleofusca]